MVGLRVVLLRVGRLPLQLAERLARAVALVRLLRLRPGQSQGQEVPERRLLRELPERLELVRLELGEVGHLVFCG